MLISISAWSYCKVVVGFSRESALGLLIRERIVLMFGLHQCCILYSRKENRNPNGVRVGSFLFLVLFIIINRFCFVLLAVAISFGDL